MADKRSTGEQKARKEDLLRGLPSIQKLLEHEPIRLLQESFGRDAVVGAARETLAELRHAISSGRDGSEQDGLPQAGDSRQMLALIFGLLSARVERRCAGGVRRVINGTGVILHTGLGRAVLPAAAIQDIVRELSGYAAVEVDVASGKRGHRDDTLNDLLRALLNCESATMVNNNAAATMLALAALARGREVIVGRGQLVEIGGAFRVPDVMRESGCQLVEVGTTNRTYARDFAAAITPRTAALMLVHSSNFRMLGFTAEPTVAELAALARKHGLPLLYDIGSGALLEGLADELRAEPIVRTALDEGASLVLFSADKILGAAQGGIAAGRKDLVQAMREHPLYRAFRVDKLTLRAVETTLRLYMDPLKRVREIPTLRMLRKPLEEIGAEATALAARLARIGGIESETSEDSSRLGSGSLPEQNIPTRVVALKHAQWSAEELGAKLRSNDPPIFTRIQDERVLIDPRTLQQGEADEIEQALRAINGLQS